MGEVFGEQRRLGLRRHHPLDFRLPRSAIVCNAPVISLGERAGESGGVKVAAIGRGSRLLPPGIAEIACIDRIEPETVNNGKHQCPILRRIA